MTVSMNVDTTGLTAGVSEASAEINRLAREEIAPAAALVEGAFASAARGIERELSRAARNGEVSLKRLGRAIAGDLIRSGVDAFVRQPIETALSTVLGGAFSGGRAEGGLVAPGQSFLVGERGPEIFTPNAAGVINTGRQHGGAAVNVSISLPGVTDAASFQASQTQIAAGLARALSRGERNR